MSQLRRKVGQHRYRREHEALCTHCDGTGRVTATTVIARSTKGGNRSYLLSLDPDRASMSERGRLGGRPKDMTLGDLAAMDRDTRTS